MIQYFLDSNPGIDVSIKQCAYQLDAIFAHYIRNAEVTVHDFVNAVEWVLLVDDSV